jgi:signal transduction histidine kinase/ligand-binding sensor domain-containing protein
MLAATLLALSPAAHALRPSQQLGQYAHTSWTSRDEYSLGAVFAMAQTPDGYLWLASERGVARFDGEKFTLWQPPAGQRLPSSPYSIMASRDGTLWIGTYAGLASWDGEKLTTYPQIGQVAVLALLEDRDGIVWFGAITSDERGALCNVRQGRAECHGDDRRLGKMVWSLAEDSTGSLWVGADSGLWRWKPGSPQRFTLPGQVGDLVSSGQELLIGIRGGGLLRFSGDDLAPYPIRRADDPAKRVPDSIVKSNKILRDREGGIWIGTDGIGLHHVTDGMAESFSVASGLSGDIACSLFEDREGNIWFASERGLDRFRKLSVSTLRIGKGPASEITKSVLATDDGSTWVAAAEGFSRWRDGRFRYYMKEPGLPASAGQALFQDSRGRIWLSTQNKLTYFEGERFFPVEGQPGYDCNSITGDPAGNLWCSGAYNLVRFADDRPAEDIAWTTFGADDRGVVLADRGGVWVGFWSGGLRFLKDGNIRETYAPADGLGEGFVAHLRIDRDGALWASTEGGLSRVKDGRIQTLAKRSGMPCNTVHWSMEDDSRALWMYTSCGLVRVSHADREAWIAHPNRVVDIRRWGAADGVPMRTSARGYSPPVTKSADGKLWFVVGEGIQVVDPDHMPFNSVAPPVYVQQIVADHKPYQIAQGMSLPALTRDIAIDFTALSLTDAQAMQFRYRLEGHDTEWQDAGSRRQAFYTNLGPGTFRFFVNASNNNGVWNEKGNELLFSIAPAYYQTSWFRIACAALLGTLVWIGFVLHARRLRREERRAEDERERLRRLEAQIAHTNRLSMLGELTASIAHEINQPIGAAMASAGAGLRWLDREQPALQQARDAFSRIKDDSKRAADIITGLRALYKKDVSLQRVSIDVNDVIREMLVLLRAEADRYSVTMRTDLATKLPTARANRVQLQQVLMNLMVNGIEAMKENGGELVVRTEVAGSGLKVSVSDTGVGIPVEQMDQIFNAFVSTKPSGTGLGLAISRTIIESHEGKLWLESRPGAGATFCFTLPAG